MFAVVLVYIQTSVRVSKYLRTCAFVHGCHVERSPKLCTPGLVCLLLLCYCRLSRQAVTVPDYCAVYNAENSSCVLLRLLLYKSALYLLSRFHLTCLAQAGLLKPFPTPNKVFNESKDSQVAGLNELLAASEQCSRRNAAHMHGSAATLNW
jgi:hypothetical protein